MDNFSAPSVIGSGIVLLSLLGAAIYYLKKKSFRFGKGLPKESVKGLKGKAVYTDSGKFLGKVEEVMIGKNKIDSFKVKLHESKKKGHKKKSTEKRKFKGVYIKMKDVQSMGEILIVDKDILKKLAKKS